MNEIVYSRSFAKGFIALFVFIDFVFARAETICIIAAETDIVDPMNHFIGRHIQDRWQDEHIGGLANYKMNRLLLAKKRVHLRNPSAYEGTHLQSNHNVSGTCVHVVSEIDATGYDENTIGEVVDVLPDDLLSN